MISGLAVEAFITLLTARFIAVFLILWIICASFQYCSNPLFADRELTGTFSERICIILPAGPSARGFQVRLCYAFL